jgi:hypothetical protein
MLRKHRQNFLVRSGQSRILEQMPLHAQFELVVRVHEGPPGAVFIAVEPFRFRRHAPRLLMVDVSTKTNKGRYVNQIASQNVPLEHS